MRAVVTRVKHASVTIEGQVRGQIGQGYLVLLGVGPNDTEDTAFAFCCPLQRHSFIWRIKSAISESLRTRKSG